MKNCQSIIESFCQSNVIIWKPPPLLDYLICEQSLTWEAEGGKRWQKSVHVICERPIFYFGVVVVVVYGYDVDSL